MATSKRCVKLFSLIFILKYYSHCSQILELAVKNLVYMRCCDARIVCASICNVGMHVAPMGRYQERMNESYFIRILSWLVLYSDLAMHLLLSEKHGMVPHLNYASYLSTRVNFSSAVQFVSRYRLHSSSGSSHCLQYEEAFTCRMSYPLKEQLSQ